MPFSFGSAPPFDWFDVSGLDGDGPYLLDDSVSGGDEVGSAFAVTFGDWRAIVHDAILHVPLVGVKFLHSLVGEDLVFGLLELGAERVVFAAGVDGGLYGVSLFVELGSGVAGRTGFAAFECVVSEVAP